MWRKNFWAGVCATRLLADPEITSDTRNDMKLRTPQRTPEASQSGEAPTVDLGAQKAAHAKLPDAFRAQAPSMDGLRAFASGAAAVKVYDLPTEDLTLEAATPDSFILDGKPIRVGDLVHEPQVYRYAKSIHSYEDDWTAGDTLTGRELLKIPSTKKPTETRLRGAV